MGYTLSFTNGWPFQRAADIPPYTIVVPAGGESKTFTLDDDKPAMGYGYNIYPAPTPKPKKKS